jgi:MFS family permease
MRNGESLLTTVAADGFDEGRTVSFIGEAGDGRRDSERSKLPQGWLFFISLYCVPCAMSSALFYPIVQPPLVAKIVGESRKHQFQGALTALQSAVHISDPFLGTLSDKSRCPLRRRAFILYGGLAPALGLFLTMIAASTHDVPALVASLCMYYSGMAYGWLPYMTVLPELVPQAQRGIAAGYQSLSGGIGGYAGNLIGILIGQGILSSGSAVWFLEIIMVLSIPLGWWALSGKPGLCQPERMPEDAPPIAVVAGAVGKRPLRAQLCSEVGQFFSALSSPAYRAYFIYGAVGAFNPWGTFQFYWFEDTFGTDYNFFGWQLTHSTQTAVAILSSITYLISCIAPLPGGYLGDTLGRRPLVMWLTVIGLYVPIQFMFVKDFTGVIITTVFTGVAGVRPRISHDQ